ncbi:MAG: NADP oxidoreductase [Betaproteobacteria bacterium]|nr:NADP oxidoreductase [Betaproteobacteria bacterium]
MSTEISHHKTLSESIPRKPRIATTSLCGCFGCHMSLLDIDERILQLAEIVDFDRSPITDIKHCGPCDVGLIEGGVCNAENVHVLREFRANCKTLVALGACAINGGLPAARNTIDVGECLAEAYCTPAIAIENPGIPNDRELPLLLDKVRPVNEIVRIDYFLPGCPPSGDAIWQFVSALVTRRIPRLSYALIKYD